MTSKESYARQLQEQISEWQKQVEAYQKMIEDNTGELQETHEKNLEAAKAALKQAKDIQKQVTEANETAWKHMQSSTENAVKQLANGWLDAVASYRNKK